MKNNRSKKNVGGKGLIAASMLGVAAIGAAVLAAYNSAMDRLVPTNNSGTDVSSTWVFEATEEPATPIISPVTIPEANAHDDKPEETEEAAAPLEEDAVEVNRPSAVDIGNILPVKGEVSHPFSNGELVKSETLGVWKTHDGCDILCEYGTDVQSMSTGIVKEISEDPLWGVTVIVEQANGLEVHYCGLAKELKVKTGQNVKQGEILGVTGDTCQAEIVQQPHLHLAVKQGGKWIDPMSIVS